MDSDYMRLALRWPDDLREKLKQSHQLLKESYLEPSHKITKPKNTKTGKKINIPGITDTSLENSTATTKTKVNPIFASTEFTKTALNERTEPKTYAQQSKEIKELQKKISRLLQQRELEKTKQQQQQHELKKCLNMKYQWKTPHKSYKAEVLGIKPVHIVEDTDIPSDSERRREEIYKVYKLKKLIKSQPEPVKFPKSAILEIKRNVDLDFSKLIMVATDSRARTTNTFYFGYLVGNPLSVYCQYFHNHVLCNSKITFKDENELKLKLARRCRNHLMSSHGVESTVDKEKLLETINPLKVDMLVQILLSKRKLPWDKERAKKIESSDDKSGNKKKNKGEDDKDGKKGIMEGVSIDLTDKTENSLSNLGIDSEDKVKNNKDIISNNTVQIVINEKNQLNEKNGKINPNLNLNFNLNPNPNPIAIIQERGYLQLSSGDNNHINNISFNDNSNNGNNDNNNNNIMNTTNTIITDSNSNTHNNTNTFVNTQGGININRLTNNATIDNSIHNNNNSSGNSGGKNIPETSIITNTTAKTTVDNVSSNTQVDKNLIYPAISSSPYQSNTLQQRNGNYPDFPIIDERGYQINTLFKGI